MRNVSTIGIADDALRAQLGLQAKERAISEFSSAKCAELLVNEYNSLLNIKHDVNENAKSKNI